MTEQEWKQIEPVDIGDAYLLVGYPADEMATLAFAYRAENPKDSQRLKWFIQADDGDIFEFGSLADAQEVYAIGIILLRRARSGLRELVPKLYAESAMRYETKCTPSSAANHDPELPGNRT